jgi:hypothetical protein
MELYYVQPPRSYTGFGGKRIPAWIPADIICHGLNVYFGQPRVVIVQGFLEPLKSSIHFALVS